MSVMSVTQALSVSGVPFALFVFHRANGRGGLRSAFDLLRVADPWLMISYYYYFPPFSCAPDGAFFFHSLARGRVP